MEEEIIRTNIDDVCYLSNDGGYSLVPLNGEKPVLLTEMEYTALTVLLENANKEISANVLGERMWPSWMGYSDMRDLSPILSKLRKKLNKVQSEFGNTHFISPAQSRYIFKNYAASSTSPASSDEMQLYQAYSAESGTASAHLISADCYITPQEALNQLLQTAFLSSPVLSITGARGQGKTELARCFARVCTQAGNIRPDLKFKSVVAVTYQPEGLRETIAFLPIRPGCKNSLIVEEKLDLLRKLPRPSLLIIDNYNNETGYLQELSLRNPDYCRLVESGVNILLTSQVNLEACDCVQQLELGPLPLQQQTELFGLLSGLSEEEQVLQQEKIRQLTGTCLYGNSYLICLAGKLVAKYKTVDQLLEAFQKLEVQQLRGAVSHRKVGHDGISRSLMRQFLTMFDLSAIRKHPLGYRIMLNLALLPTEGMDYDTFLNWAFPDCEEADQEIEHLKDSFWLFISGHRIRIHPMIREMLLAKTEKENFSAFRDFVQQINEKSRMERYCPEMPAYTGLAAAANQSLVKLGLFDRDQAFLVSNVASNYDTMRYESQAYHYGVEALNRLDTLPIPEDPHLLYLTAYFYSVVGYSVLHDREHEDAAFLAERSLKRAMELVQTGKAQNSDNVELLMLECKIQGNLGALYQKGKNYKQALRMHEQSRDRRRELFSATGNPEFQKMLADSYRSIATDYFYLSKGCQEEQARAYLELSLENHRKNLEYWRNSTGEDSCDYCIGINRLAGTWITLLNLSKDREAVCSALPELQQKLQHTVTYLGSISPIPAELNTCLGNVLRLYALQKAYDAVDPALKELLIRTDDTFRPKVFAYPKGWKDNLAALQQYREEI